MTKLCFQPVKLVGASVMGSVLLSAAAVAETTAPSADMVATDATWITIQGDVTQVDSHFITVDTGDGSMTVDTSLLELDQPAFAQMKDSKVTVTAQMSDEFMTSHRLSATGLYVQSLGTAFVSPDVSAQQADAISGNVADRETGAMTLTGTITAISEDAFQFSTGKNSITVETDDLDENPLDKEGYYQLSQGDRVSITTTFDDDLTEDFEVEADTLIRLSHAE